jgi:hypothetical protein
MSTSIAMNIHKTPEKLSSDQEKEAQKKLDVIIEKFGESTDRKTVDNLKNFLKSSPEAREQLLIAVANGDITKIDSLDPKTGGGASYHSQLKTLSLNTGEISRLNFDQNGQIKIDKNSLDLTRNIIHETQHGHNGRNELALNGKVAAQMQAIASDRTSANHDYTAPLAAHKNGTRENEASAEIASYNGVVAVYKRTTGNLNPTAQQLYEFEPNRMPQFIAKTAGSPPKYEFKNDQYDFNADRSLTPTAKNLEASAVNYYDKKPEETKLGARNNLDYTHNDLQGKINAIFNLENSYRVNEKGKSPTVSINMQALGLNSNLVQDYYDPNTNARLPFTLIDTSNGKQKAVTIEEQSPQRLDAMITKFGADNKNEVAAENLRQLLNKSPELKESYIQAVKNGELTGFTASNNSISQFTASSSTISLPLNLLEKAGTDKNARNELAYSLGRNNQLAYEYSPSQDKSFNALIASANTLASNSTKTNDGKLVPHDYTKTVGDFIDADRAIVGRSNIVAYNSVVEQVKKDNPNPTLKDVYEASPPPNGKMGNFIAKDETQTPPTYRLKEGLQVNQDMSLNLTATSMGKTTEHSNVNVVGKIFHDLSPAPGVASPKTEAAAVAIRFISNAESQNKTGAEVRINMAQLGLNETAVNQSLSERTPSLRYTDTSNGQNKPSDFSPFSPSPVTPGYQAPQIAGKPTDLQNLSRAETAQTDTSNGKLMQSDQLVSARTGTDQSPTKPFIDQPFQTSTGSTSAIKPMLNNETVTSLYNEPTKPFVNQQHANLYQQAFDLLGKNPSQFGITNVQAHETAAYNLSSKSLGEGLGKIDTIVASTKNNGDLFAVQNGQSQEFNQRAHVEAKSLQQPIGQNVAQLQEQVEQQSQTQTQQAKVNAPSLV